MQTSKPQKPSWRNPPVYPRRGLLSFSAAARLSKELADVLTDRREELSRSSWKRSVLRIHCRQFETWLPILLAVIAIVDGALRIDDTEAAVKSFLGAGLLLLGSLLYAILLFRRAYMLQWEVLAKAEDVVREFNVETVSAATLAAGIPSSTAQDGERESKAERSRLPSFENLGLSPFADPNPSAPNSSNVQFHRMAHPLPFHSQPGAVSSVLAYRDGEWVRLPTNLLVKGDMLALPAGDIAPGKVQLLDLQHGLEPIAAANINHDRNKPRSRNGTRGSIPGGESDEDEDHRPQSDKHFKAFHEAHQHKENPEKAVESYVWLPRAENTNPTFEYGQRVRYPVNKAKPSEPKSRESWKAAPLGFPGVVPPPGDWHRAPHIHQLRGTLAMASDLRRFILLETPAASQLRRRLQPPLRPTPLPLLQLEHLFKFSRIILCLVLIASVILNLVVAIVVTQTTSPLAWPSSGDLVGEQWMIWVSSLMSRALVPMAAASGLAFPLLLFFGEAIGTGHTMALGEAFLLRDRLKLLRAAVVREKISLSKNAGGAGNDVGGSHNYTRSHLWDPSTVYSRRGRRRGRGMEQAKPSHVSAFSVDSLSEFVTPGGEEDGEKPDGGLPDTAHEDGEKVRSGTNRHAAELDLMRQVVLGHPGSGAYRGVSLHHRGHYEWIDCCECCNCYSLAGCCIFRRRFIREQQPDASRSISSRTKSSDRRSCCFWFRRPSAQYWRILEDEGDAKGSDRTCCGLICCQLSRMPTWFRPLGFRGPSISLIAGKRWRSVSLVRILHHAKRFLFPMYLQRKRGNAAEPLSNLVAATTPGNSLGMRANFLHLRRPVVSTAYSNVGLGLREFSIPPIGSHMLLRLGTVTTCKAVDSSVVCESEPVVEEVALLQGQGSVVIDLYEDQVWKGFFLFVHCLGEVWFIMYVRQEGSNGIRFSAPDWKHYLQSLKPIGLAALVNAR